MTSSVIVNGTEHHVNGAHAAIIQDGKVLIQLRPWPPGWELPGGHCSDDENPATCAAREAREETGYDVEILRLVGVYHWQGLRTVGDALYAARIIGGTRKRSLESLRTAFVDIDSLPKTLFPWFVQRIADALESSDTTLPQERVQRVYLRHAAFFGTQWLASLYDGIGTFIRRR